MTQLPKADEVPDAVEACFHVCIDIPGFGRSTGNSKTLVANPATVLSDVIRSLGKSHAYALVGAEMGVSIIVKVSGAARVAGVAGVTSVTRVTRLDHRQGECSQHVWRV